MQADISYLIVGPAIYMCICDSSYPRKLAFSYLDELSKEFQRSYGDKIDSAQRPYAFMGFGECSRVLALVCGICPCHRSDRERVGLSLKRPSTSKLTRRHVHLQDDPAV